MSDDMVYYSCEVGSLIVKDGATVSKLREPSLAGPDDVKALTARPHSRTSVATEASERRGAQGKEKKQVEGTERAPVFLVLNFVFFETFF